MVSDLSTQLDSLMSLVEGPFSAHQMLASKSNFTMLQLNFYAKIDDNGVCRGNTEQMTNL
jgi:hypothetical protein